MKYTILLKNGSYLYGDYVDVMGNFIRLTEVNKMAKDDKLEDSTFVVYLIDLENVLYSSCTDMTWDEYCEYIEACDNKDKNKETEDINLNEVCNCETCTECDYDQCDDASNVGYDCTSEPGNMFN